MKFMMNGAITIATLDGANIEIKDEVGEDNIGVCSYGKDRLPELYNGSYGNGSPRARSRTWR